MDRRTPHVIEVANETPEIDDVLAPPLDDRSLHPDAELVARFAADGFDSPEFHVWFSGLINKVSGELDTWICNEMVYVKLRSYPLKPINLEPSPAEREALRTRHAEREDLVAEAINAIGKDFVDKALRGGKWDPRRGASVKTFFTRAVLFKFATAFKRWRNERIAITHRFPDLVTLRSPEAGVDFRTELETELRRDQQHAAVTAVAESDMDREIMACLSKGMGERAIAEQLGLKSPKRVRTVKKHMKQAYGEFEGGHDA